MTDWQNVVQVPQPCLVVLVGPSSAGKSTWAAAQFEPDEIVSSDRLRAVVGRGEDDLEATDDAFALLTATVRPGDTVLVKSSNSAGLRFLGDRLGEYFS